MLRADVPVGCYLSGGLDSSLVAALGLRAKGAAFCTFSIRFEDAEYDEGHFQRLMAKRLGTDHREVVVSRRDIVDALPAVVWHAERPILRTAPAPLFLLSRTVRQAGIKAVLTGEGADEVFAGYDIFREGKIRRFWARQPQSLRRPLLLGRCTRISHVRRSRIRRSPVSSSGAIWIAAANPDSRTCPAGRPRTPSSACSPRSCARNWKAGMSSPNNSRRCLRVSRHGRPLPRISTWR